MLRSFLEKWSRGIVLKKKLPAEFGNRPIYVSPEGGGLRYWKPGLKTADLMLTAVVRQFIGPGDVVWDIGGNVGLFTFPAAVKTGSNGKVIVFEPDISLAYLLRKTADSNPDLNVEIFALAVSNQPGMAQLNIAQRARASNFLADARGSTQTGGIRRTIAVPTISLDDILRWMEAPRFVKIDVEGAEHLVLQGMTEVLRSAKPTLLCEVSAQNHPFVASVLQTHGYNLYDARALPELKKAEGPVANIIAIPTR